MRIGSILAFAVLVAGCSSHSGALPAPTNITPQIIQKQPLKNPWLTTKLQRDSLPNDMAVGAKGYIWVPERGRPMLSRINMTLGAKNNPLSIYPVALTIGSDKNVWVSSGYPHGLIARVTPAGEETDFTASTPTAQIPQMITGPDGAVWFTVFDADNSTNGIGRVDVSGVTTFFPFADGAYNLIAGPDGNLWFSDINTNIFAMNTQGQIINKYALNDQLYGSTIGHDGAIWFTGYSHLYRVTTSGQITRFTSAVNGLFGIASWSGGLGITFGNELITFDTVSETFGAPIHSPFLSLRRIITGQDGNFWMTGLNAAIITYVNQVMSVTPTSLTLQNGKSGTLTITETNYTGTWKAQWVGSIVNVVQTAPGVFTVTAVGPGTTKVTIQDSMRNHARIPVTVH